VDDDPATADGYVAALEAAAGGLGGREVLLLGLGPVGRAAARRLIAKGASVLVVEPDEERVVAAQEVGLEVKAVELAAGLSRCSLVLDASPAAAIIDTDDLLPGTIAAVPGLPSAFTPAAQAALGARHIHEPLAIGVAVMAVRAVL
jgi:glutamate dehydrogenase/leucine dehydrogenase